MIFLNFIAELWSTVWPYLVAVLIFIVLIVIHEFGHFITAKLCGVRVNEFAVGFGPKLFKKKKGETTYAVNLIPLGGYCAMEGEDEESSDDRAFCNKGPFKRLLIVAAGAIFNLLLGLILVAVILIPEKSFASTTVAYFEENATSNISGLELGDTIIKVDGRRIYTTYDLGYAFTGVDDGKIDITVVRNDKKVELKDVTFKTKEANGISYLTLDFKVKGEKKTFLNYCEYTIKTAFSYSRVVLFSLIDLIKGKYGISAVSGPVGITATVGAAAKTDIFALLPIMALITINLGIFNLLPIPALDGGRILFILIELIFRKPVPQKYEGAVHTVGLIILLGFMLLVTIKDIITLF